MEAFIDVRETIEVEKSEEEDIILIKIGKNRDGTIAIQIWDARNTSYIIKHNGKNMFEEYLLTR